VIRERVISCILRIWWRNLQHGKILPGKESASYYWFSRDRFTFDLDTIPNSQRRKASVLADVLELKKRGRFGSMHPVAEERQQSDLGL
jgi:hypothetical protein